jgi:transposase-like protein
MPNRPTNDPNKAPTMTSPTRPNERRKPLLTEHDAAAELGLSPATLRYWRHMARKHGIRRGPPWLKLGERVLYERAELDAYKDARRQGGAPARTSPDRAAGAGAPREGEAA